MKRINLSLFLLTLIFPATGQHVLNDLDGSVTANEKSGSRQLYSDRGISLSYSDTGAHVSIRIIAEPLYVASLCLADNMGNVHVLHASAALGQLTYSQKESWNTDESFAWSLREKDMSESTLALRENYLDTHGWVATTRQMGTPGEVEFLINKSRFPSGFMYLAAGLMPESDPENILAIPASGSGDCANHNLVSGDPEEAYSFHPADWLKVVW